MKLRALSLVGLLALSLSAVACSSETSGSTTSDDNEVRASSIPSNLSNDELKAQLAKAVDGLQYTSESDYDYDVFVAPGAVGAAVDADAVKAAFNGEPSTKDEDEGIELKNLIGSEIRDFNEWSTNDTADLDQEDETSVAYGKGMTRAYGLMKANLKDLKVVLVAAESLENTEDVGLLQVFLVGRAKDGSLVALHTFAVWT